MKEEIRGEMLGDIIHQYIYYLRNIYPVKENETLINSAIAKESN